MFPTFLIAPDFFFLFRLEGQRDELLAFVEGRPAKLLILVRGHRYELLDLVEGRRDKLPTLVGGHRDEHQSVRRAGETSPWLL
jgi:hypothetical protein